MTDFKLNPVLIAKAFSQKYNAGYGDKKNTGIFTQLKNIRSNLDKDITTQLKNGSTAETQFLQEVKAHIETVIKHLEEGKLDQHQRLIADLRELMNFSDDEPDKPFTLLDPVTQKSNTPRAVIVPDTIVSPADAKQYYSVHKTIDELTPQFQKYEVGLGKTFPDDKVKNAVILASSLDPETATTLANFLEKGGRFVLNQNMQENAQIQNGPAGHMLQIAINADYALVTSPKEISLLVLHELKHYKQHIVDNPHTGKKHPDVKIGETILGEAIARFQESKGKDVLEQAHGTEVKNYSHFRVGWDRVMETVPPQDQSKYNNLRDYYILCNMLFYSKTDYGDAPTVPMKNGKIDPEAQKFLDNIVSKAQPELDALLRSYAPINKEQEVFMQPRNLKDELNLFVQDRMTRLGK